MGTNVINIPKVGKKALSYDSRVKVTCDAACIFTEGVFAEISEMERHHVTLPRPEAREYQKKGICISHSKQLLATNVLEFHNKA